MKIKTFEHNNFYSYSCNIDEINHTPEQFDYIFKYLDFDKLDKDWYIIFNNEETEEWFRKTYINSDHLISIYDQSPEGYQWLKENLGKNKFRFPVRYPDKQGLKTIVNKLINIKLLTKE